MKRERARDKERDRDKTRGITFEFQSMENNILSTDSSIRNSHQRQGKRK
jgi:hypothetical protein